MAKYIDAEKFMETIKANDYLLSDALNNRDCGMFTADIEQAIAEQPTFDPYLDRKAVVCLIKQALKDSWKNYDPRLESFAEGLIEKIKKMDGPTLDDYLDQSLRAAEPAQFEEPRTYPVEPIKPEDIPEDDYIDHLIDGAMEKLRENGGKLTIVFTYGGKVIEQIKIS